MMSTDKRSEALVLSGGGAYAAYEVGVMKALFNGASPATSFRPLDPEVVTGTSAGAFNAALLLSTAVTDVSSAVSSMEDIWINEVADSPGSCGNGVFRFRGNALEFFEPGCVEQSPFRPVVDLADDAAFFAQDWLRRGASFFSSSVNMEQRLLELIDLGSLISTQPFVRLAEEDIRPEVIRRSDKVLKIAATNWRTGRLRVFGNEDMSDQIGRRVVLASGALPGIFPSVEIEGEPYVDGGLITNTPLKPAIDAGADILHTIYVDPDIQVIALPRLRNTISTAYRMLIIGFGATMNRDIEIASRINRGIQVIERAASEAASTGALSPELVFILGKMRERQALPYRQLTIHRYHPREDLGGVFRWLSFGQDQLIKLMELGFRDTVNHDCAANRCVLPE